MTLRERVDDFISPLGKATTPVRPYPRPCLCYEAYVRDALRAHYKQEAAPDGTLYGDLCAPLIEELIAKSTPIALSKRTSSA